ncbi:MAG: hypothetical protein NT116_05890 [Candidatus Parcubacteria bacterium]|nr:hypothetical protein [Candidatus Parcubacteria bacterium]
MNNNKEIEFRGILGKKQYFDLLKKLILRGYAHEKDDKISYFFVRKKGIFKINDEISKNQAKISLKLGDEERGKLHESEVVVDRRYFNDLLFIFQKLGFTKYHKVEQKRDNFLLKDFDVELSLKYTIDFQYHFEIEYLGNKIKSENKIKKYLKEICDKFNIVPLEEKELLQRIQDIKKRHRLH